MLRAIVFVGLLVLAACERPFVATTTPEIEVLEPDFTTIFFADEARLRVRASSFRDVPLVQIDGRPMSFNQDENAWETKLQLGLGLNTFFLTAFDVDGIFRTDTLFAVRAPIQITSAPFALTVPVAHHTATFLSGETLIAGGNVVAGGPAVSDAFTLRFAGAALVRVDPGLQVARTGHAATLLPDGRVLITGGSRTDEVADVSQLVESPEIFDPATRTFFLVPVVGEPIRRTRHSAILRMGAGGPVIDLLGGRGDVQYRPSSRLGIRSDLRSFLLRNDTLIALSPAPGGFIEPITDQTETPLTTVDQGELGRYLVAGSFFDSETGTPDPTSLVLDYLNPAIGLRITDTEPAAFPRTGHAAIATRPGYVLIIGGRQASPGSFVDSPELYVDAVGRYFRFPKSLDARQLRRDGASATFFGLARILVVGGLGAGGTALPEAEFIDFEF